MPVRVKRIPVIIPFVGRHFLPPANCASLPQAFTHK
jgi:hypothetical protein